MIASLACVIACAQPPAAAPESAFVPLFDGRTLEGWVQRGGKAAYLVEDGCIVGETRPDTPNSFLCTTRDYADFELRLEFLVDNDFNSGIQIRSNSLPEYREGIVHGYQVEIDTTPRAWSGGIYDEGRRGWLDDLKDSPDAQKAFKHGEWNTYRILCEGDHIRTWINDVPAADLRDGMTASGFIGLQVHSVESGKAPIRIRWRNIRVREITAPK